LLEISALPADEVLPHRQDQPPNPPRSPEDALLYMRVPEGFSVEVVASEPDIINPIAMTFDDRGRIWITESIEYPRKPAGPGRDRVKILEDTNGDGRANQVTTFASDLNIPTGVAVGYGGVWVLNAPDLLFFREENGKPLSREVVVTGFGRTDTHELPNSLTWGPDGWLYGLNGVFNESRVVSQGREFKFNCAMWRIHPRTREFQVVSEGTSNPYGIAWDFEGSAIVEACHWANDHLFHFVETGQYQRQAGAYPGYTIKIGSITDHGHQKTAYCGIALFDSDAYPEKYRGRIYVGNIHGGCINADRLQREGASYLAKADPDFLSANDAWFMPVSLKVGPDGCFYILDWYDRYHCSQDAARDPEGVDRLKGRLYRVRYQNSPRAPRFNLATESDRQLIERLGSSNIFFRENAQRNLTERLANSARSETSARRSDDASKTLRGALEELALTQGASRTARLHAMWSLIGTDELAAAFHLRLLNESDAAMRAWGVRAAGNFRNVLPPIRKRINELSRDPSPDVQLQVAIASRKISEIDSLSVLTEVLATCGVDKLIPAIAWNNLHPLLENEGIRFVELVRSYDFAKAPALANLAPLAVDRMLGVKAINAKAIRGVIELLAERDPQRANEAFAIVARRANELTDNALAALRVELRPLVQQILSAPNHSLYPSAQLLAARLGLEAVDVSIVRSRFLSRDEPENSRLQALESMIAFKDDSLLESLPAVLASSSISFTRRTMNLLGRLENAKVAEVILAQYGKLDPELQPLAIELLLQRELWARQLLKAVREKRLPAILNANHLRKILESNDREAIWEVEKVFGKVREERNPDREKVVAEMAGYLRAHPGNARAGREVFRKTCWQCHAIYGQGGNVGPDITSDGRASFEQLLSNVFDPSLVIAPAYQMATVVTLDGRNLTGLVTEETAQRIVVKVPGGGVETVPRSNIKYTHLSKLSMMPEGLETMLDRKEISDLFAFLALDRPPEDKESKLIPGAPQTLRAQE
jgi:putative membrane-bound dehydrogenase-like protein